MNTHQRKLLLARTTRTRPLRNAVPRETEPDHMCSIRHSVSHGPRRTNRKMTSPQPRNAAQCTERQKERDTPRSHYASLDNGCLITSTEAPSIRNTSTSTIRHIPASSPWRETHTDRALHSFNQDDQLHIRRKRRATKPTRPTEIPAIITCS